MKFTISVDDELFLRNLYLYSSVINSHRLVYEARYTLSVKLSDFIL